MRQTNYILRNKSRHSLYFTICIQELTGQPAIAYYMVKLIIKFDVPCDPYWMASAVASHRAIVTVVSSFYIPRVRRRPLFMASSAVFGIGTLLMGCFEIVIHKYDIQEDTPWLKWIPVLAFFIVYTGSAMGYMQVIYSLLGELMPSNVRSIGVGLIGFLDCLTIFLVAKFLPHAVDAIGLGPIFLIFTGFQVAVILFTYFCIPETYGLTLEQIEDHYRRLCNKADADVGVIQ